MKNIEITTIKAKITELIARASFYLPSDIEDTIRYYRERESGDRARQVLDLILENSRTAAHESLPLCQDCGNTYIDLEIGPDVCVQDSGNLHSHVDEAVALAYERYNLRKSTVGDPVYDRVNRADNTPAILSVSFTGEPGLGIKVSLKGGGSENCSYMSMENPTMGEERIKELVLDLVRDHVTRCCPPVVVGVGIGSTASGVVKLARTAAFRELDKRNSDSRYRRLEYDILKVVNNTGIGPQGLGGDTTAIGCNIEFAPCHMATLPVAVFLQCHSLRRASFVIQA